MQPAAESNKYRLVYWRMLTCIVGKAVNHALKRWRMSPVETKQMQVCHKEIPKVP